MKHINNRPPSSRTLFWQNHVDAWSTSGLTQAHYCRNNSLNRWSFYSWKGKLHRSPMSSPTVVAVELPALSGSESMKWQSTGCHLQVKVHHRFTVEIYDDFSPQTLVRLIETLERIA